MNSRCFFPISSRHVGVPQKGTLCQITRVRKTVQTWDLDRVHIYLPCITCQFLDFIHWMVFDFYFDDVTVKTGNWNLRDTVETIETTVLQGRNEVCGIRDQRGGIRDQSPGIRDHCRGIRNPNAKTGIKASFKNRNTTQWSLLLRNRWTVQLISVKLDAKLKTVKK